MNHLLVHIDNRAGCDEHGMLCSKKGGAVNASTLILPLEKRNRRQARSVRYTPKQGRFMLLRIGEGRGTWTLWTLHVPRQSTDRRSAPENKDSVHVENPFAKDTIFPSTVLLYMCTCELQRAFLRSNRIQQQADRHTGTHRLLPPARDRRSFLIRRFPW